MTELLIKYMESRYTEKEQAIAGKVSYFVTISREYGCPANPIAEMLVNKINEYKIKNGKGERWGWINKQVIEKSAIDLNIDTKKVEEITNAKYDSLLGDFLNSLSGKYYPSDIKIRKTIKDVIRSYALKGNMVIVGRGGVAITSDLKGGIHIWLEAPLEWRQREVIKNNGLSEKEALKLIAERDRQRLIFRESFKQNEGPITFDLIFNCAKLTVGEISGLIFCLMERRGFL